MKKSVRKLQIHRETLQPLGSAPKAEGGFPLSFTCTNAQNWCQSISYCVICKVP
jgi:hypothetical protein